MRSHEESRRFWMLAALAAALVATGLGAAHFMEEHGHAVTGMNNQIVWGLPHVFAIFMIVAASGVLNVASVASVFGQAAYKSGARLSGLLCLALLAGGLMVLMLDLGRPERVIVAATHYNLSSVFAWNVLLYSGMAAVVVVYLWTMFERRLNPWTPSAGLAVLVWRFVLTTGTGSIFGFLVARQAYQSALLAPLFIVLSLSWGMAVFLLVQPLLLAGQGRVPDAATQRRMARLLGVFVAVSLYLVAVYHLTNAYHARQRAFETWLLLEGGHHSALLWLGFGAVGSVLPMVLLFGRHDARRMQAAALAVLAGAFAYLYVFIIGGQAYPLELMPGHALSSTFGDGQVASYSPSLPEWLLGIGGLGAAWLITLVGTQVLDFLPRELPSQARH